MEKNKKILFSSIGILVGALVLSIFAFVPIGRIHDSVSKSWMSKVSDDTKVLDMSLPGTHDSGATHSIADVAGKCQDVSIKEQLYMGVRAFDLRLQLVNDKFKIVHDFVDQRLTFETVVNDFKHFLNENPSEFLFISVKDEKSSVNSTLSFNDAFMKEVEPLQGKISFNSELPETLKEARGKIYIVNRFGGPQGINAGGWRDNTTFETDKLYVQDYYCISDVDSKKQSILNCFEHTKNVTDKLVINFTSCYIDGQLFPPTYAGTPALSINPWLVETLKDNDDKVGIILADFITENLSKTIYERNM